MTLHRILRRSSGFIENELFLHSAIAVLYCQRQRPRSRRPQRFPPPTWS